MMIVTAGPVREATDFIERTRKRLKCEPPADLEYGCMKD